MAGNGWVVPPDSLSAPPFIAPGEPGIIFGPDLPAPLQARYIAAILLRPGFQAGLDYNRFIGIAKPLAPGQYVKVECGWYYDDYNGNGWYYVDDAMWMNSGPNPTTNIDRTFGAVGLSGTVGTGTLPPSIYNTISILGTAAAGELFTIAMDMLNTRDVSIQDVGSTTPISIPRGIRLVVSATANTGAIAAATSVFSTAGVVFRASRAYDVTLNGRMSTSLGTVTANMQFRTAGVTRINFGGVGPEIGPSGAGFTLTQQVRNATAADITRTVDILVTPSAGTVNWLGAADYPRSLQIRDAGPASLWPNAPAV